MGGASAALGMIASFWASSVGYLYLSYGVLVGIGAGLSFPPTVYIVTSYFVKYRGLANGLCISGSALGSIILPPILRWLLEEYGYRGAVLIMGGITLNVFVAAIFYEPVENHMIRIPRYVKTLNNIEEEDIGIVLEFQKTTASGSDTGETSAATAKRIENDDKEKEQLLNNSPSSPSTSHLSELHHNQHLHQNINDTIDPQFIRSASANVVNNFIKHSDELGPINSSPRIRKISTPIRLPQRNQTFTPGQLNSQSSLFYIPETGRSSSKLQRLHEQRNNSKSRLSHRFTSISSFQYISTPYHGSTLSFQPKEFTSHVSLKSLTTSNKDANYTGNEVLDKLEGSETESVPEKHSKFFDLSLLKDPTYLVILISNSTNAIGYTNFIILLPAYGVALGFNKSMAAYLISIVSTTDLVGRIGGSALSDLGFIPKTWYFIGGLAISGLSLALLPFSFSYVMLSFWCALFGLASGVYVGITAVIMADLLGTERLTSSYGISLFVNGILQLIGPPLCGLWFETVQTYDPLFHTLGVILLAGASLWSFMPIINKHKTLKENKITDNFN